MIGYSVVNAKGQVTIPADIRTELGISPGLDVIVKKISNSIVITTVPDIFSLEGSVKPMKKMDIDKMEQNFKNYLGTRKHK